MMMDQYYHQNKDILTKDMSSSVEIFIYDLLRTFNNDVEVILAAYDQDRNNAIDFAEFTIVTSKCMGSSNYPKVELENIFRSLKGEYKELRRFDFQDKLIDIKDKYNQVTYFSKF